MNTLGFNANWNAPVYDQTGRIASWREPVGSIAPWPASQWGNFQGHTDSFTTTTDWPTLTGSPSRRPVYVQQTRYSLYDNAPNQIWDVLGPPVGPASLSANDATRLGQLIAFGRLGSGSVINPTPLEPEPESPWLSPQEQVAWLMSRNPQGQPMAHPGLPASTPLPMPGNWNGFQPVRQQTAAQPTSGFGQILPLLLLALGGRKSA
jgi:hypothetical protein